MAARHDMSCISNAAVQHSMACLASGQVAVQQQQRTAPSDRDPHTPGKFTSPCNLQLPVHRFTKEGDRRWVARIATEKKCGGLRAAGRCCSQWAHTGAATEKCGLADLVMLRINSQGHCEGGRGCRAVRAAPQQCATARPAGQPLGKSLAADEACSIARRACVQIQLAKLGFPQKRSP